MSVHVSSWAWNAQIPGTEKIVLLAVADAANDDGECWLGQTSLAQKVGTSDRSVRENLRRLEDRGLIARDARFRGNGSRTSDTIRCVTRPEESSGGSERPAEAERVDHRKPTSGPEPSGEPSGRANGTSKVAVADAKDEVPGDFPDELRPHARIVMGVLRDVAVQHGARDVKVRAVARALMAHPRKPLVKAAQEFASWAADPPRPIRDVVSSYRTWLDRERDLAAVERLPGGDAGAPARFKRTAPVEMQGELTG